MARIFCHAAGFASPLAAVICVATLIGFAGHASAQTEPDFDFATYLGGTGIESVNGLASDADGNLIATGWTSSSDFQMLNAHQSGFGGVFDAFITKMDPVKAELVFSTFLGGSGNDFTEGVATDSAGNVFIIGTTTSANFPTLNAVQGSRSGPQDALVAKFDPLGELLFSTYLGGGGSETGMAIKIGESGSVYVAGITTSNDFPTVDPTQSARGGGVDVFVTRLSADGSTIEFSTYLGGSADEGNFDVMGLEVGPAENIYVTSWTKSSDFATQGRTTPIGQDVYVAAIRRASTIAASKVAALYDQVDVALPFEPASASDLNKEEQGNDIAYAPVAKKLILIGTTDSDSFPTTDDAPQRESGLKTDGFLTVIDPATLLPGHTTLIAGPGDDLPWTIDLLDDDRSSSKSGILPDLFRVFGKSDSFEMLPLILQLGAGGGFMMDIGLLPSGLMQYLLIRRLANNNFTVYSGARACIAGAIRFFAVLNALRSIFATPAGGNAQDALVACQASNTESDLEVISKEVEPDSAYPGQEVTYKIRVKNNGPDDVDELGVVDGIPNDIAIDPAGLSSDCQIVGNAVVCSASLKSGEEKVIEIKAKVKLQASGSIENTVVVDASGNTDPDDSNNTASALLTVRKMVVKISDPNTVFHRIMIIGPSPNGKTNPYEEANRNDDFTELATDLLTEENQAEGSTTQVLREPRKQKLISTINETKERAKPGEEVTLIFQGHGWNGVRKNGSIVDKGEKDESVGGDETFWLDGGDVSDDELADWIEGFEPGVTIALLLTSCYGGGFTDGAADIQEYSGLMVIGVAGTCPQDGGSLWDLISLGLTGLAVETLPEAIADGAGERRADANQDGMVTGQELEEHLMGLGWELGPPEAQKAVAEPVIPSSKSDCGSAEFGLCEGLPGSDVTFDGDTIRVAGRNFHPNSNVAVSLIQTDLQVMDTLETWSTTTLADSTFTADLILPETVDRGSWILLAMEDEQGFYDWWITHAGEFVVDEESDQPDASPGDLKCETDGGVCTLRAAIEEANKLAGPASITTAGPIVVRPDSALPVITDELDLKGGQQLELDGSGLAKGSHGAQEEHALTLSSDGSTIEGIEVYGFSGAGVAVLSGVGNSIRFVSLHDNALPIDLGGDGPTSNDLGDADEGPNRLMNAPDIRLAEESNGRFTVHLSVDTDGANATYPLTIDFYASDDNGALTWVAEAEYDEPGQEQAAIFFSNLGAGVDIVATATDADGNTSEFGGQVQSVVDVETDELPPIELALAGGFPNPFTRSTTIPIEIPGDLHVQLHVYDLLGKRVATLVDGAVRAGRYMIEWDATNRDGRRLASGTYLVRLEARGEVRTERLVVVR